MYGNRTCFGSVHIPKLTLFARTKLSSVWVAFTVDELVTRDRELDAKSSVISDVFTAVSCR